MADEEEKQQVNTQMPLELAEMLDAMCESDEQTRSGFIRMLIRMEFQRRQGLLAPSKVVIPTARKMTPASKMSAKVAA